MLNRVLRRAEIGDSNNINNFFNRSGGTPVLKQAFGAFSATAIVETAYLSIVVNEATHPTEPEGKDDDDKPPKDLRCLGLLSISDNTSLAGEPGSFESRIAELNEYIPCTVCN